MTTSRTTSRIIILLLFLAGLLLLRKPVFGQAITIASKHASVTDAGVQTHQATEIMTYHAAPRL